MPDLRDGQSVEVRGSAAQPYRLKNVGGVYSCSCPAWRNQSLPIERRTCKHLRALRGDAAEAARVGTIPARRTDGARRWPGPGSPCRGEPGRAATAPGGAIPKRQPRRYPCRR